MKILFLRFSSIGDVVITSAVVRCVRKKYPKAHLGFATKKAFAPLVAFNPHLHQIHALENRFDLFSQEIKEAGYTHVIDLHKNLRTKRLKTALRNATWYSYKKLNWQKWLLVNFKVNRLPNKHIVHRYFEGIKALEVGYDEMGMDFYFPESIALPESIKLPERYTLFAIGGTYATKRLPIEKLEKLIDYFPTPLVLIGGKEDFERSKHIKAKTLTNLCGELSLLESAYVLKGAEKVIAHDSGFMHIAAALNKPLLSIWGSTVPDFGFFPLTKRTAPPTLLLENDLNLKCRPCSKLGHEKCPKEHFKCMDYKTEELLEKLNALSE